MIAYPRTPARSDMAVWLALGLILALAAGLRLYRLDFQSFWNDEGASALLAQRPFLQIARDAAADIHPPLYYFALRVWWLVFGGGEFALRSLSVITGLALVALTFLLGRRLFGTAAALLAALAAAVSPLQIYYSQEARMYIQLAALGALSVYLFARLVSGERRSPALWIGYLVATAACLYTQYFAFTLVLAQNLLYAGWWTWRRVRPRPDDGLSLPPLWQWISSQAAIGLLFLPWALLAWRQLTGWPATSAPFTLLGLLKAMGVIFSGGTAIGAWWQPWMSSLFYVAVGAGALFGGANLIPLSPSPPAEREMSSPRRRGEGWGEGFALRLAHVPARTLALAYLLVPVLAMYALSLQRPAYNPKFLLLALPGWHLLLGQGLVVIAAGVGAPLRDARARWLVSAAVLALLLAGLGWVSWQGLNSYYFDSRFQRDNWRGLVRLVEASARPGDAVILDAPGTDEIYGYYARADLPRYPLPRQRPIDEAATVRELEDIAQRHPRLWLTLWGTSEADPHRVVERWCDEHAYKTMDRWFGGVRLVLYSLPGAEGEQVATPLNANFDNQITLLEVKQARQPAVPGDVLSFTFGWRAERKLDERYKVFVHVLDRQNHIVGQRDAEPGGGARLTTLWQPGVTEPDNYGVQIQAGTPPGDYMVEVGLYNAASGQRLNVLDAHGQPKDSRVLFGPVQVTRAPAPPALDALEIQHPDVRPVGPDLRLLGYDLWPLGAEGQPEPKFRLGAPLHLTLFWQALAAPRQDIALAIELLGASNQVVTRLEVKPAGGDYSSLAWSPEEVVRDQHNLVLPEDAPAGALHLRLTVTDARTGHGVATVDLGTLEIKR